MRSGNHSINDSLVSWFHDKSIVKLNTELMSLTAKLSCRVISHEKIILDIPVISKYTYLYIIKSKKKLIAQAYMYMYVNKVNYYTSLLILLFPIN